MMEKEAKIYVAGHRGMVGSAIVRALNREGYVNIITRSHAELNLCRQEDVEQFFAEEKPDYVCGEVLGELSGHRCTGWEHDLPDTAESWAFHEVSLPSEA